MFLNFTLLWASGLSLTVVLIIAKYAVAEGVHPLHFAFFQALGSFLFILLYNPRSVHHAVSDVREVKKHVQYFTLAALLGIALPQMLAFYAVIHVGVGIVSLSYCLPLVVSYCISLGFKLEQYDSIKLLFLFLTVFGTFIYLLKPEYFATPKEVDVWYLLLLIIPLSVGAANIYRTIKWPPNLPVTVIAMWTNFFAALLLAIMIFIFANHIAYLFDLSLKLYGLILIQMFFSGVSQILAFLLQKRAGPVFISQTGSVVTVTGGVFGYLIFSENYSANTLLGSICIFVGVYLYSRRKFNYTPHAVTRER